MATNEMPAKPTVLIVEDSVELVELLQRSLRDEHELHVAFDGPNGLAKAKELKPDILLLDVNLPLLDGFDVLREVRSSDNTRETVVLMLTALSEPGQIAKALSLGADDYIVKPFNLLELTARIKSHLTIRTLQRQLVDVERLKTLREMAVSFSHEINNPLMSIMTFATYLRYALGEDNEQVCKSIAGILEESNRISSIVKKLSAASKAASVDYSPGIKMINFDTLDSK